MAETDFHVERQKPSLKYWIRPRDMKISVNNLVQHYNTTRQSREKKLTNGQTGCSFGKRHEAYWMLLVLILAIKSPVWIAALLAFLYSQQTYQHSPLYYTLSWQIQSLIQSDFSRQYNLALPLSTFSTLSFP